MYTENYNDWKRIEDLNPSVQTTTRKEPYNENNSTRQFGKLFFIEKEDFVDFVDKEDGSTTILVHMYRPVCTLY